MTSDGMILVLFKLIVLRYDTYWRFTFMVLIVTICPKSIFLVVGRVAWHTFIGMYRLDLNTSSMFLIIIGCNNRIF